MIIDLRPVFRALPRFTRDFMPYSWYGDEWWNLNDELGKWITPHLKAMRERGTGWPVSMASSSGSAGEHNDARVSAAFNIVPSSEIYTSTDWQVSGEGVRVMLTDDEAQAQWNAVLDEMIEGFQLLAEDDTVAAENRDKINRAFALLAEHWPSLWD